MVPIVIFTMLSFILMCGNSFQLGSRHALSNSWKRKNGLTIDRPPCFDRVTNTQLAAGNLDEGISLIELVNVRTDAAHLKHTIASWLDKEYIPQEIHKKLGGHVETHYSALRSEGIHDLGELLIRLGTELEKVDMEDAFVNAWDVANKAADLLIARLDMVAGGQDLDSSSTYQVDNNALTTEVISNAVRDLQPEFSRYTMLKNYLDGDVPYTQLHPALALQLGFRLPEGSIFAKSDPRAAAPLKQYRELAPLGWENLGTVPDFSALDDAALVEKMQADLPEDDASSDLIIESLLGLEYYNTLKVANDPATMRRVLVTKWMYVQGFLNDVFPPVERFVPFHRLNSMDD